MPLWSVTDLTLQKKMLGFLHVLKSMKRRICLIDNGKNGHNEFTTGAKIPLVKKKKDCEV